MANEVDDLSYLNDMDNAPEPEEDLVQEQVEQDPVEDEQDPVEVEQEDEKDLNAPAQEVEVTPQRRSETRIQKLANERATEREARIRAEAERDALLKFRPTTAAPDNAEAIRLRHEKLNLMEPQERAIFLQSERLEQINNQLMLQELRSEDRADKAAYDARAVVDPRYSRYKDDVEKELRDLRTKGINATRDQVLAQVIGRRFLSEKPRKGARVAAAQRVDAVKSKPANARGVTAAPAGKGDSLSDLESRLRGKSFNDMFGN